MNIISNQKAGIPFNVRVYMVWQEEDGLWHKTGSDSSYMSSASNCVISGRYWSYLSLTGLVSKMDIPRLHSLPSCCED